MNGVYGGLPFYNTAGMPPMQALEPPPPVYSDTSPTPYATDQPALIPEQTSVPFWEEPFADTEPTWFDWQAPLDIEGLRFPEMTPVQQPPSPTIPSTEPTMTAQTIGLPSIPYYQDTTAEQWVTTTKPPGYGPLELIADVGKFAGDVVKTGLDAVWDLGKHILDNLEIGYSTKGVGVTSPVYQSQYPTAADRTGSQEYVRLVAQGGVTGTTEPTMSPAWAGLGLGGISPNVLLIGGGVALLLLLTRR